MDILLRVAVIWLLGLAAARFCNWAIYSWAWHRRSLGPWAARQVAGDSSWIDQLPVWGWWALRREDKTHGRRYWLRPLLIELCFPLFIAWYYQAYVSLDMFPAQVTPPPPVVALQLHWQFTGHFVLFTLMVVATFIDFDEQSIPDFVTVTGTVIGLVGATLAPAWLPFNQPRPFAVPAAALEELQANTPNPWPQWMDGTTGLYCALVIILIWAFALLDRRWITRRGLGKALQYFVARLVRSRALWIGVGCVSVFLLSWVTFAWWQFNGPGGRWQYLLSSLFGLAFAGGVTWGVRLSASAGLGVEALGFGDVTLMAMIGTFLGWQPSLLVFFLAPLVAIAFVLLRAIITGDTATPYGPYLCAATVIVLVLWDDLWTQWASRMFALGPTIVGIIVACVALMGVLLWIWRLIKQLTGLAGH